MRAAAVAWIEVLDEPIGIPGCWEPAVADEGEYVVLRYRRNADVDDAPHEPTVIVLSPLEILPPLEQETPHAVNDSQIG
jgi:hypothetical protein